MKPHFLCLTWVKHGLCLLRERVEKISLGVISDSVICNSMEIWKAE